MLEGLINSLTGSLQTTSYSYPASNGINTVSPKATFKNFFSNLLSSLSSYSSPSGQQYNPSGFNPQITNNKRNIKALSPGSFINSATLNQQASNQITRNQAAVLPPLQGFAGQAGFINPAFPAPGGSPQGPLQSQFAPLGGFPQTNAPGGILPMLIMPIVGLFTLIGSLFKIKGLINGFKPVEINKNVAYDQYNKYLDELYASQGSFDPMPDFNIENANPVDNAEFARLQEY